MIINQLQRFVEGEIEMTNGQVTAAKILLDRVLPPLRPLNLSANESEKELLSPQLVIHLGSTEIPGRGITELLEKQPVILS